MVANDMARQQAFRFKTWGGKRRGAGRPRRGKRAGEPHKKRPPLAHGNPVHVTIRAARDLGSLRKSDTYAAIRAATLTAARQHADFHIVHISIQATHVHLIVEASDRVALARGMQGFEISAARHVNRAITKRLGMRRTGPVFPDRYHPRILNSPRSVRHAIAYVLNNWRHHGAHVHAFARRWRIDPFSSAIGFDGWKSLAPSAPPPSYKAMWTWLPRTWLLSTGWRRHGLIRADEIPGLRC
ncbi:MAG TPA: transposase [Kofleriaceae bacterium]|nr:transposase [Kofleriaceae bacterium]